MLSGSRPLHSHQRPHEERVRMPADRASAIQSIGQLLKQQERRRDRRDLERGGESALGNRPILGSNNQSVYPSKNKTAQLVDLNNNKAGKRQMQLLGDEEWRGGGGELLKWRGAAAGEEGEEQQFRCCAVCGGRIWSEATGCRGGILEQNPADEELVHSACFRCATCGLDLGREQLDQVVKRGGRFYCALHGRLAAPKGEGQKKGRPGEGAKQERADRRRAEEEKWTRQMEKERNRAAAEGDSGDKERWWERSTEQFNGSKGSGTTFRYYGNAELGAERSVGKNHSADLGEAERAKARKTNGSKWPRTGDGSGAGAEKAIGAEKRAGGANWPKGTGTGEEKGGEQAEDKCEQCGRELSGSFVLAKGRCWCPEHFVCANSACGRRLLEGGFVEEADSRKNYCPDCYECLIAPICHKCSLPLTESCLNALDKKWHPDCFACTHCRKTFGTRSFYVENGRPYCEEDWNQLFSAKCAECLSPIKVGQKWLEALGGRSFHAQCFKCTVCHIYLEGKTFFERDQRPYCRAHASGIGGR